MRRFSQRNSLVTLSEINITPLLDLAFVLLIIFIITTPYIERSVKLNLPGGGQEVATKPRKEDLATVEITRDGEYIFRRKSIDIQELERALSSEFKQNPRLAVVIRADRESPWGKGVAITDICERYGIQKVGISTKSNK